MELRLKTIVGAYVISTIRTAPERIFTGAPVQFETVVFSDDEAVNLRNGEVIIAFSRNEYEAHFNHQLTVDWVRRHADRPLNDMVPPRLA